MKIRRTSRARIALLAFAAAISTMALGAGSASAFGPLGTQYGVGIPSGDGPGIIDTAPGIAIGADGSVIVGDVGRNRISVFSPEGRFLRAFGKDVSLTDPGTGPEVCTTDCKAGASGSGAGELTGIWGLAAGPDGIYVVEQGNARISVFSYQGAFLRAFGRDVGGVGIDVCTATCQAGVAGSDGGQLAGPYGIGLGPDGRLYVSNVGTSRVEVFDAGSGAFVFAFGKDVGGAGVNTCTTACQAGVGDGTPGSMAGAFGLAVGPGGEVYVTDMEEQGIQVFSSSGAYQRRMGAPGAGAGQFAAPYAVAVDPQGLVYAVDIGLNRLSVFGPSGEFRAAYGRNVIPGAPGGAEVCTTICGLGEPGYGIGEFTSPLAVAADCRGSVYTGTNGRVEKWGEPGVAAPPCPPPPAPPTPTPTPLAKPSNAIVLGKLKLNKKKGTATLVVTVPGPGALKASAGKKMKAKAPKPKRAGKLKLTIKAKGKGLRALNRTGKLKGKLRLTFQPTGGDARTVTRKLTLLKTGYSRKASADSKRR